MMFGRDFEANNRNILTKRTNKAAQYKFKVRRVREY